MGIRAQPEQPWQWCAFTKALIRELKVNNAGWTPPLQDTAGQRHFKSMGSDVVKRCCGGSKALVPGWMKYFSDLSLKPFGCLRRYRGLREVCTHFQINIYDMCFIHSREFMNEDSFMCCFPATFQFAYSRLHLPRDGDHSESKNPWDGTVWNGGWISWIQPSLAFPLPTLPPASRECLHGSSSETKTQPGRHWHSARRHWSRCCRSPHWLPNPSAEEE